MITLDHATHTYHNSAKPTVKYTSVTTVLGTKKQDLPILRGLMQTLPTTN